MSIYVTPICFTITVICYALAIFKFKFLSIAPIALQNIVDRISDGYLVVNEDNKIIDFNETFLILFNLRNIDIRNRNLFDLLINHFSNEEVDTSKIKDILLKTRKTTKTVFLSEYFEDVNKHFNIEFSSLNKDRKSVV